jgi:hypothetical protein
LVFACMGNANYIFYSLFGVFVRFSYIENANWR